LRVEHKGLADLAASIADGVAVDWSEAEERVSPADRRLASHLRLVESIASLHRSIPSKDRDADQWLTEPWTGDASSPSRLPESAEPTGPHWGRLTLLERIGEGTSCEVYRAWDTALHRDVALKLLHADGSGRDGATRILEEARRLARVRHGHVVHVYGAEQHDDRVGLWMELVRGESLEQIVKARGPFGAREAALIGLDLCAAVAAVHGANLLHRDIKAQNVMREGGGRIVLMDFGTGEELSGTNRLVGTPLYLAPEIFRGQRASVQSDLYSLGVLLFYLVTGKFPVTAGSMEQLARLHSMRERQSLRDLRPDVPEVFVRTVERALESDPIRRFQTAGDLASALRESLEPASNKAPVEVAVIPPAVARRPRFGLTFGVAAAVLAAVITALIVWVRWPSTGGGSVNSLAVLPLIDSSRSGASELSEAMTEQLIATIGQVDSLRTTSLMSTLPFRGSDRPRTEIAKLLGVDAVLEGILTATEGSRGDAGSLRLDASLVAAASGATLWSGSAVARRGESAALLAEIARAVTRVVGAQVTRNEATRLQQVRRTNPEAEEAYLQGRLHLAGYGPDAANRALKSFERAIASDPNYAAAHASAALAYVKLAGFNAISHGEARLSARAAIRSAYETGDDIAEAHAAEADLLFLYDWDWHGAEREYRRSLELNPGFLHARNNYAQVLAARKRFDEMLSISEESLRMDPQSVEALVNHGMLLYYKRDWAGADRISQQALAIAPGNEFALLLQSRVAEAQQRYDEALAMAKEARRLSGDGGVNLRVVIIRLQALAGQLDEARAATAALEKAHQNGTLRVRPRDLAYVYLALGRHEDALDQFEKALDERDPSLIWLTVAPRVDVLRKEPRFQAILQKVGLD
jgi:serine/threonine protein kinase/tetratricopeptide (TPR) repeat protein